MKASVGGQSHAIAGPAVWGRDRADKADDALGTHRPVVHRFVSRIEPRERLQRPKSCFDPALGISIGDETSPGYLGALPAAEWHQFDEADMPVLVPRQERQLANLLVVQSACDHAIELDWREARSNGRVDPRSNRACLPTTHDLGQGVLPQAVDVNVHAVQSGGAQGLGQWRQQHPVGRHGDIVDAFDPSAALDDLDEILPQSRFASGKTDPAESNGRRGLYDSLDLTAIEQILAGSVRDLAQRHAVDAAQVAVVGQGNPEIIDVPLEAIDGHEYCHANGAGSRFPAGESEFFSKFV